MELRAGVPRIDEVEDLVRSALFAEHVEENRRFLARHSAALRGYGSHWGEDPLGLWSRRWEYPFVAQRMLAFAKDIPAATLLDAGSGVTYFDPMLCDRLPGAKVVCVDSDPSYTAMFDAINRATPGSRVSFVQAMLQSMPLGDATVDGICCISVLEHTDRYGQILDEFARVLRPGGALVLTFDLSLDGKFELSKADATALLQSMQRHFAPVVPADPVEELGRMDRTGEILSTDHVKRTRPELLPWKHPLLKGLVDLAKGKGWTGGFRSKSVYCLEARKR